MGSADRRGQSPPNIVMLVLDTARARNLSCYGHNRETTPTIDTLADDGVRFARATSVSPWTLPSHASLFTGVPPSVHRTNSLERCLPESLSTLAGVLSDHGYDTVGMSANPWLSSQFGVTDGFDRFHHLFAPLATDSYREFVMELTDAGKSLPQRAATLLSSQSFSELARNGLTAGYRQLIDRDDDGARKAVGHAGDIIGQTKPYFLFINFLEPHLPFDPPEDCRRRFVPEDITDERLDSLNQDAIAYNIRNVEMESSDFNLSERLYDAEIYHVDRQIKRILGLLDHTGQRKNTIVFVLGDHGENIGDHGLMGHQYSVHETLTHIPLVVHYPGLFEGGNVAESRVSSLDIPATIADLLTNHDITERQFENQQQGVPLYKRNDGDRTIVSEYLNPMPPMSRVEERSKMTDFDVSQYYHQLRAIYDGNNKFVRGSDGHHALYDLTAEPNETDNVVETNSDQAAALERELDRWLEKHTSNPSPETSTPAPDTRERLSDLGYL